MAVIKLTKGYETVVDDDVVEAIKALGRWCALLGPSTVYAVRSGSIKFNQPKRFIYLHRWIANAPRGINVDHRNGDGLDNRRDNLRLVNQSQNMANSIAVWGSTGCRGVYKTHYGRFAARVKFHGKKIHIGVYSTPEEAAVAYEAKRVELFGEFAPLVGV
jgi:hypothetical protein